MGGWAKSFRNQLGRVLGMEVKLAQAQCVKSVKDQGCQKEPPEEKA